MDEEADDSADATLIQAVADLVRSARARVGELPRLFPRHVTVPS